ncbi:Protein CBG18660 [Caenorhabditis briggsae]|uniref:Protein CBG18660 n=1 Tax=Caenorhabditis briggsae TaxID=6238 RepID=A8XTU4_CAEBR|nr:Protein CBG18660 [Caenorhabditis briggsae]CAP36070.1 Protein CBG18660 [Caenorhabditis briggsae]
MFPFYVYVNRVNRERDKNTLLFPLIDHFYGMMKKTQAIYCFLWFFMFFLFEKIEDFGKQKKPISTYLMYGIPLAALCLCVLAMLVFTHVFQFFLTIMAVQKFLLYFYPSSQKYIVLSSKNMHYFIRYVYYLFISKDVISRILFFFNSKKLLQKDEKGTELVWLAIDFDVICFATLNISFFISALLYIPILISVQKKSHLRSVQESKPQIYIFSQTITVLVVKMISYLTCNRQNVITLFASFKGMKLVKELIKPEATTRVSPDPGRHRI